MGKSLQEQLLGAGLTSEKKLKEVRKQQHQQRKQKKPKKARQEDAAAKLAQQRAAQAERDRLLNQQKQAERAQKERQAQVRQLIKSNSEKRPKESDLTYHFKDGSTIKKLYVSKRQLEQLSLSLLSIVKLDDTYVLVPHEVAVKLQALDAACVLQLEAPKEQEIEDDYYKQFEVPDDLMW